MTRDIAAPHFAHVAHPICLACHVFVDGVARTQRRLKREAALPGSTVRTERVWTERKTAQQRKRASAKGSQEEVVV